MNAERRIFIATGAYAVLVGLAFSVPRIAARGQSGLAAAGVAAGWFLFLGALALLASVVALVMAVRAWKRLSLLLRTAGLAPAILTALVVVTIIVALKCKGAEASSPSIQPKPVTAPAVALPAG